MGWQVETNELKMSRSCSSSSFFFFLWQQLFLLLQTAFFTTQNFTSSSIELWYFTAVLQLACLWGVMVHEEKGARQAAPLSLPVGLPW